MISSIAIVVLLLIGGAGYYQATHFNPHVSINGIKVGGLTVEQTANKLQALTLENKVYVGNKVVVNGKDTKASFTKQDLPKIKNLFKKQQTWLPSFKTKNYALMPGKEDHYRSKVLRQKTADKLKELNQGLQAPKDAQASLDNGKIIVSKSKKGNQYDVAAILKDYDQQKYNREIRLKAARLQPVLENSPTVKREKKKLEELAKSTVTYKVQNKPYPMKASEVIEQATVDKNMKLTIDTAGIKNKVAAINRSQSTLHKNYSFKTHSGSVISVKGQSYGWALDVPAETKRIAAAFEKGKASILAYNVYGEGYSTYGIGYHVLASDKIGNTYAEVSIKDQKIWIYKNGHLKVATHVVTGRHDTHEDTPKGVWYVEYKESPSTLEGSEAGNPNYSVKVKYWAPFTLGGVGFHDASWRTNWAKDAYLHKGSGGCVNIPPSVMKTVYDNLEQNEPVIVY
ncbi:L,D-transpeptidase family protein [Heyndrickxia acidiproducens]|uniref:L,D-transpeptidase family protein n=1 Tax=Heyndrickxia acidiproducens TaxID=1121084 RepID=UPI00037D7D5A|nr:L,D-transpeptidase family protein [Heyndrickxia acidiproducens]